MKRLFSLVLMLPLAPLAAQEIQDTSVARTLAGCWSVMQGPVTPGGAPPYARLPRRVQFETTRSTSSPFDEGWMIRNLSPASPHPVLRRAYYVPVTPDSLKVIWTDGTMGMTAGVRIAVDTLRGRVETFSDQTDRTWWADITFARGRCPT